MKPNDTASLSASQLQLLRATRLGIDEVLDGVHDPEPGDIAMLGKILGEVERMFADPVPDVLCQVAVDASEKSLASLLTKASVLAGHCIASAGVFRVDEARQLSTNLASRIFNVLVFGDDWFRADFDRPEL